MKTSKILTTNVFLLIFCAALLTADVTVAPVPWVPESGNANTGSLTDGIKFAGVPNGGEISIYTVSGNLVIKIPNNSGSTSTISSPIRWYGKNSSGNYVASGVYLWVVKSTGKTQTGKLIVVR